MKSQCTPEILAMIREMAPTTSTREIAKRLGFTHDTIHKWSDANGIVLRRCDPRPPAERLCKQCGMKRTFRSTFTRTRWMCVSCDNRDGTYPRIWEQKHPEKRRASRLLRYAVESGTIARGSCEVCGIDNTHGHHEDYSKPLDVVWLCSKHHASRHRELKRECSSPDASVIPPDRGSTDAAVLAAVASSSFA
jgi:hypothetical protein